MTKYIFVIFLISISCIIEANEYRPPLPQIDFDQLFEEFNNELVSKGHEPLTSMEDMKKQLKQRGLDQYTWYFFIFSHMPPFETYTAYTEARNSTENRLVADRSEYWAHLGRPTGLKLYSTHNKPTKRVNKDYTDAGRPSGSSNDGIDDMKGGTSFKGGEFYSFEGKFYFTKYHPSGKVTTIEVDRNGMPIEEKEPDPRKDEPGIQSDNDTAVKNEHESSQDSSKKIHVTLSLFDFLLIMCCTIPLFFFLGRLSVKK